MRYFFLLLVSIILFSCTKSEKKEELLIEENMSTEVTIPVEEIIVGKKLAYTVQIAALMTSNTFLENLDNVSVFKEDSLIKYRLGNFDSYEEAKDYRKKIRKAYPGAFVQALLNDTPIVITEALQY